MIYYIARYICPKTKKLVSWSDYMNNFGICSICGHDSGSTITHAIKQVGYWKKPTLFNRIFKGQRSYFVTVNRKI